MDTSGRVDSDGFQMIFTIEDIKRLIPEATSVVGDGLMFRITINGRRYYSVEAITIALLTTRRQLEIAMEVLREVNASTSSSRLMRVTAEALKSIKKVGEA